MRHTLHIVPKSNRQTDFIFPFAFAPYLGTPITSQRITYRYHPILVEVLMSANTTCLDFVNRVPYMDPEAGIFYRRQKQDRDRELNSLPC